MLKLVWTVMLAGLLHLALLGGATASVYPWTEGQNATIAGTGGGNASVVLLSFTPGSAVPDYAYNDRVYYLVSYDPNGHSVSNGYYHIAVYGNDGTGRINRNDVRPIFSLLQL